MPTPTETNKQTILHYTTAFNAGDLTTLRSLFTEGAQIHGVLGSGGLDLALPIWQELHTAFAIQLTPEEILATDTAVVVRYTERGTFRAPFRGHPPTGKSYQLPAIEWFTLRDGKISHRHAARDSATQFRQIDLRL
jgi:steroid delta-isomerase-like uncharacterized protein